MHNQLPFSMNSQLNNFPIVLEVNSPPKSLDKAAPDHKDDNSPWTLATKSLSEFLASLPRRLSELTKPVDPLHVVLDMDEMMVRSNIRTKKSYEETAFCLRPGLLEFLKELKRREYHVQVFTAGTEDYAKFILDRIEQELENEIKSEFGPEAVVFEKRFYRDSCERGVDEYSCGCFVKNLENIGFSSLDRVVLVDNNYDMFRKNLENGILVEDFYGAATDRCLDAVLEELKICEQLPDVRPYLKKRFRLSEVTSGSIEEEVTQLCRHTGNGVNDSGYWSHFDCFSEMSVRSNESEIVGMTITAIREKLQNRSQDSHTAIQQGTSSIPA